MATCPIERPHTHSDKREQQNPCFAHSGGGVGGSFNREEWLVIVYYIL